MSENPSISAKEIAEKLGVSSRSIEMRIAKLKKNNIITRIGPAKGGHWAVVGKWRSRRAGQERVMMWESGVWVLVMDSRRRRLRG